MITDAAAIRDRYDVVVMGAGNAAMCAALSAREQGGEVLVLERAPAGERGGNTAFTGGAMRVVYRGVDDLRLLIPDLTDHDIAISDFGTYPEERFFEDMARVTQYRADPDLVSVLVRNSHPTLRWMADKGIRFAPGFGRQAFKIDGVFRFSGGVVVEVVGGGPGLVEGEHEIASRAGIRIVYEAPVVGLVRDDDGVHGVKARIGGRTREIGAGSVVIAAGGFQANVEWRTRYLGPNWDLAKVRGTRFNTGEGHRVALEAGAAAVGHWSGCHSVGWDRNAPDVGDLAVGDGFQKHSYPFGIMVNATGRRFVDEGADFRPYTYAKYGAVILAQPQQFAWQIFDQKVVHLLRDEYRIRQVTKVQADTIEELAVKLEGVEPAAFVAEVQEYNAAIRQDIAFDPTVKDGRCLEGTVVPKSNWANTLDEPPFMAFQVTCGITFTFGGLSIAPDEARVLGIDGRPIPGLFAAGEVIGGLFFFNYPAGTGLTAGSVFGRIAGHAAAVSANQRT